MENARMLLPLLLAFVLINPSFPYVLYNGALYCNTTCDDCEDALNNATYDTVYLNSSLSSPGATCIDNPANFSNKTFDCQGNTITGNRASSTYGTYANSKSNITLQNCRVYGFYYGFNVQSTDASLLQNLSTFNNSLDGIRLYSFSSSTLTGSITCNNSHEGATLDYSTNNTISNNTFCNNSQQGLEMNYAHGNIIENNTAYTSSTCFSFYDSCENNTFRFNTANNPFNVSVSYQYSGIGVDGSGNIIANNTFSDNPYEDFTLNVKGGISNCDNIVENNTGSGGLPINFTNEAVAWSNFEAAQVILCNADNSVLTNITVTGSSSQQNNNLYIAYTDNATISFSNSSDNVYGAYMRTSENNTFFNNTFADNFNDFYVDIYLPTYYHFHSDAHCNHILENNTGSGGLPINFTNEAVAWSNFEAAQVILCNADNSVLTGVSMQGTSPDNNYLVSLLSCDNVTVAQSSLSAAHFAVYLELSRDNTIANSTLSDSYYNFYSYYSNGTLLEQNTISGSSGPYSRGAYFSRSYNNTIRGNTLNDNSNYQLCFSSSNNNFIYNNILNASSGQQVLYDTGTNSWNASLNCTGTSIVGGDCLGGNWYSNYTGEDADGDGIGDTVFSAYGMTDYLPLYYVPPPPPEDEGTDVECTRDSDCGECEICDVNECVLPSGACLSDSGCTGEGETCSSCECIPPECVNDGDCPDGYSCGQYVCMEILQEPEPVPEPGVPPEEEPSREPEGPPTEPEPREPTPETPGNATEPEEPPTGEAGQAEVPSAQPGGAGGLPGSWKWALPSDLGFFLAIILGLIILYLILTRIFPGLPGGKDW